MGQIPALKDDEVELFESGAILLYLAQKYGGMETAEKLAKVSPWVVILNPDRTRNPNPNADPKPDRAPNP